MWQNVEEWDRRQQAKAERPGEPDEIIVRSFTNNLGAVRYIVEGRKLGIHLGDKLYPAREDALVYANMLVGWHRAKLIDETAGGGRRSGGPGADSDVGPRF